MLSESERFGTKCVIQTKGATVTGNLDLGWIEPCSSAEPTNPQILPCKRHWSVWPNVNLCSSMPSLYQCATLPALATSRHIQSRAQPSSSFPLTWGLDGWLFCLVCFYCSKYTENGIHSLSSCGMLDFIHCVPMSFLPQTHEHIQ